MGISVLVVNHKIMMNRPSPTLGDLEREDFIEKLAVSGVETNLERR